jgi:lysophospholipase L1-like esterase
MILPRFFLVAALVFVAANLAVADFTVTFPLPPAPAGTSKATYPVPRTEWFAKFQSNLDKLKDGPYDLVFDGDSITDFWQTTGQAVFKAHYGAIKAADFAISGDQTQHVLWRLQHGELEGQNPKLILLMIGTNNQGQDPKEVAQAIKMIIGEYETRCPAAHILLQGIFPRGEKAHNPSRQWIDQVNKIISTYDDGKRVTYIFFGDKFLQPDGTLTKEIMPDFLHPSAQGYEIWAGAIQPIIDQYFPPAK